ncbi:hypothetical protein [Paenibacillus alginolyticus]|nr:hypothetical protein [Paenibacillus frigoriresistens]
MDIDILLAAILHSQDDWNITTTNTAYIIDPSLENTDSDNDNEE